MTMTIDTSPETEAWLAEEADWQALSYRSLWEIWDNKSDAIYDTLPVLRPADA